MSAAALGLWIALLAPAGDPPQPASLAAWKLRFEGGVQRSCGVGFRIRSPRGATWTVASATRCLEPDGVPVIEFEQRLAELGFGTDPAAHPNVRRATAGQDLWWSDLLLLEGVPGPQTEVFEVRRGALEPGESLTWHYLTPEGERSEAVRWLVEEGAWLELDGPQGARPSAAPGSLLLDSSGRALAMVSSLQPGAEDQPGKLLAQRLDSLAGLPAPLRGQSMALPFETRGFDSATLSPAGELLTWSRYLGGLRAGRPGAAEELERFRPLRRSVAAAFAPDGLFLATARGPRIELRAGPELELLDQLEGLPFAPNRLVWSIDGGFLAAASNTSANVLLWQLTPSGQKTVRTPPTSALAAHPMGGFLHGTLDGELRILGAAPSDALIPKQLGEPILSLAPIGTEGRLAVGQVSRVSVLDSPAGPERWSQPTGVGEVQALFVEEDLGQLWVATGSLVEQPDGTFAEDAYVRVFELETGRELARSHFFDTPPRALFRRDESMLSLTESGELWAWSHPAGASAAKQGE